ncbi:MAG: hypothetical protein LBL44_11855 [Treponema sp.]|jgi:hypothetical protein|nr:hypothetical protein [Treponema sp.]
MNKENLNSEKDALKSVIIDLMFTFLPIFVLLMIQILTGSFENVFVRSDWSYISMILFGQTIIKIFSGISENQNKKRSYEVVFHVSLVIALGLVPSIIILVLIEMGHKKLILFISQILWLLISIAIYLFLGTIGNILSSQKLINESDFIIEGK